MISFPKFEKELEAKVGKNRLKKGKIDAKRCKAEAPLKQNWDVYVQTKDYKCLSNNVRVRVQDGKLAFIICNCEQFSPDSLCEHAVASLFAIRNGDQEEESDDNEDEEEESKDVLNKRKNSNDNDDDYDDYAGQKRKQQDNNYIGFKSQGVVKHFPKLGLLVNVVCNNVTCDDDASSNHREGDKLMVYEVVNLNPKEARFKYEVPMKNINDKDSWDRRVLVTERKHKDLLLVIFYEQCDSITWNEFHLFKLTRDGAKESKPLKDKYYTKSSKVEYGTHLSGGQEEYKIVFSDTEPSFEIIRKELPAKFNYEF